MPVYYCSVHVMLHRVETMQHAKECLARFIRLLLGKSAVADGKLEHGLQLVILGIELTVGEHGFRCRPSPDKIKKWLGTIDESLSCCRMTPGAASKLAGQLNWASSRMFNRLGRAMLRPIFDQQRRYAGEVDNELCRALQWWRDVLALDIAEVRQWELPKGEAVHLFCDASGSPGHLGAVLFDGQCCEWTHAGVPEHVLECFRRREDNQIMGLELLAIALAIGSFKERLRSRRVVVHCDNTGAEVGC